MPLSAPVHRTIVVVDVADFTKPARTSEHQVGVRKGMYNVLTKAFAETGIDLDSCHVEDRGDGAMILVPSWVPTVRLADALPQRLLAGLHQYNAEQKAEMSIRLRVSLHAGEVHESGHGVVSTAVNFAFRIIEASAAKTALRESAGVLAVIASDSFYWEVISHDPGTDPVPLEKSSLHVKRRIGTR